MHAEALGGREERQTRLGKARGGQAAHVLVGQDERIDRELVGIEEVA
jgi:hypothetical protein